LDEIYTITRDFGSPMYNVPIKSLNVSPKILLKKIKKSLTSIYNSANVKNSKPGTCIPTCEAYKHCPVKANSRKLHELVQGPVTVINERTRKQIDDRKK
jgi:hypothetical protein